VRLDCRNGFLVLLGASAMACHKAASAAQPLSREYVLESVDGQSLPAIWHISKGDTSWVHSGKISLYPDGNAVKVAYQTHTYHGTRAGGGTSSWHFRYRIRGDTIEFGFNTCKAPCFRGEIGRISDSTLTLAGSTVPPGAFPLYKYRRSHTP
jgi:hypothetical protein